jgi:PPK2 family polyphosphate:nucleotide phosphotransferase
MGKKNKTMNPERKVRIDLPGKEDIEMKVGKVLVPPGRKISLRRDFDPAFSAGFKNKEAAQAKLQENIAALAEQQAMLYAQDVHAVLLVLQAMDAAGKDGVIKHVMSGVNPQGCSVSSFKAPSPEELDHDYLWRYARALPPRGHIGIFNRSHYEEVLVVRVHPEILKHQRLPRGKDADAPWKRRYEEINNWEKYLVENGVRIVKVFLNVSKEEQKARFLSRIDEPDKNWKFSDADVKERGFWDAYQDAFEDCFNHTSTEWAPWFVVPADKKWFARLVVSEILLRTLRGLKLAYPEVTKERRKALQEMRVGLEKQK